MYVCVSVTTQKHRITAPRIKDTQGHQNVHCIICINTAGNLVCFVLKLHKREIVLVRNYGSKLTKLRMQLDRGHWSSDYMGQLPALQTSDWQREHIIDVRDGYQITLAN